MDALKELKEAVKKTEDEQEDTKVEDLMYSNVNDTKTEAETFRYRS
jgi:hypothetical protein